MARETKHDKWVMATNAVDIFHGPFNPRSPGRVTTGQPYIVKAATEDALMGKVFIAPERGEDGEYHIDMLTPKASSAIIAQAET